jgi:deoxyribodipyrimidine photo-lyase
MTSNELLKTRIKKLNSVSDVDGECVLYVMSRDQRVQDNHALLAAQKHAIAKQLPLCVVFCLYDKVVGRAREQFQFMIDGLRDVESRLEKLNIPFMMLFGSPSERIGGVIHHTSPDAVYFDFSPLRGPRTATKKIADMHNVPMYVVDTHNMIPVWATSDKREIGARTIRSKIHKNFAAYLEVPDDMQEHPYQWPGSVQSISELSGAFNLTLEAQQKNGSICSTKSGESAALKHLAAFVTDRLEGYAEDRNDPSNDALSGMSPYLHFGQISSLRVAIEMKQIADAAGSELHLVHSAKMPQLEDAATKKIASANALLEEMIVRKELSDNFCYYEPNYDSISSADNWAKITIQEHVDDVREYAYNYEQLEQATTHDPAWNAAQKQMMQTGKMHGYMRMYWAKKVLEWSPSRTHGLDTQTDSSNLASKSELFNDLYGAEWAVAALIRLNDFYSIDGGDPNGYVGILWSVAGVHDRAWTEREVFGKVRYMNYGGLKRKFNIDAYEKKWNK